MFLWLLVINYQPLIGPVANECSLLTAKKSEKEESFFYLQEMINAKLMYGLLYYR